MQLQQAEGDINQDNAVSDIQHTAVKTFEPGHLTRSQNTLHTLLLISYRSADRLKKWTGENTSSRHVVLPQRIQSPFFVHHPPAALIHKHLPHDLYQFLTRMHHWPDADNLSRRVCGVDLLRRAVFNLLSMTFPFFMPYSWFFTALPSVYHSQQKELVLCMQRIEQSII